MSILNEELDRILSVMGVVSEQESPEQMNINLRKTIEVLKYLKVYNKKIEKMLMEVTNLSTSQIIDFHLLERGLKTVLLKKGDKRKNVEEYFARIISSLKLRDKTGYGPDSDDEYGFEIEEPSIVPKKVYRKELFELQVELLKMQEWLNQLGKTVIIVFVIFI
jgi:hypothetical protein